MQTALRTRLKADGAIAALVGTRIDWGLRPQAKSLPAISLLIVPTPRDYHMGGAQVTQQYRVQCDCWGVTYKSAFDVAEAVIACLEPSSGEFQASFVERRADMPELTDTGEVHRVMLEFKITHIPA